MNDKDKSPASQPLQSMFVSVPPRYDIINHIITLGMDIRWRKSAAKTCLEKNPRTFLDLGCGTGDLSITVAALAKAAIEITGLDYSVTMLKQAQEKANLAGAGSTIRFVYGQADNLPFPDGCFDCAGISFAFRNLTYKNPLQQPHLAEVVRVLKKGGRYVIVETSQPENVFIRFWFHLYLKVFVAPVGTLISGERDAYHYLSESMTHYYSAREIEEMLLKAGFAKVKYRHLFFGAAAIHIAVR